MTKRRTLLFSIILIGVALALFGLQRGYFDSTRNALFRNADSLVVKRESRGGISGYGDGRNLTISNSQITLGSKTKPLTKDQVKEIIDRIDKAGFFEINQTFSCDRCADQFTNTLSITIDNKSNMVTFDDIGDVPDELLELDAYLVKLVP